AMVRAVEQSGVICQIGSQQRSGQEFQRVYELVQNGLLGEIKRVRVGLPGGGGGSIQAPMAEEKVPDGFNYDMWLGPAPYAPYYHARCPYEWRWIFDYSGGQLTDWIGHHFDCSAWMTGVSAMGPVAIEGAAAVFPTDNPLYNTAQQFAFQARYANGVTIEVSSALRNGIVIDGSEGSVHVDRGVLEFSSPSLQVVPVPSQGKTFVRRSHWTNFLDCVVSGETPICPIQEAHRSVSVAHLANLAFRTGRSRLDWDPVAQRLINAPDAERLFSRDYRSPWQLPV
ncbi:MAG TPA: hypothetical protein VNB29_02045, partial [Chthoniobacterales bacterium]|nr:hypothetical protein [Chthoniobacterales bacterium]